MDGVIGDGDKFGEVKFAILAQNAFVHADVLDLAEVQASFDDIQQLTLQRQRQFIDDGRIDKITFCGGKTGFFHFIRGIVCGNHAHIIAGGQVLHIAHRNGKSMVQLDVIRGLVAAEVNHDLVCACHTTPCSVHGVCVAVFIVSTDDHDRLGIQIRLCTEIFTHRVLLLFLFQRLRLSASAAMSFAVVELEKR